MAKIGFSGGRREVVSKTPSWNPESNVGEEFIRLRWINPLPGADFRLRHQGYGGTRDDHPLTAPRASENFFKLFLGHDTKQSKA
jgi:hypothetical protein